MKNIFFNSWNLPENDERLELVFAGRFKAYGAYHVRRVYRSACIWAMMLAGLLVTGISAIPLMADSSSQEEVKPPTVVSDENPVAVISGPETEESEKGGPAESSAGSQEFLTPKIRENATVSDEGEPVAEIGNPGKTGHSGEGDDYEWNGADTTEGDLPPGISDKEPVTDAFIECVFPGGEQRFLEFFKSLFQYPDNCLSNGIEGYVKLKFVVDVNGRISRIKAVEETAGCPEFTNEAIRILQLSPDWIPAQKNGRFVSSWRELRVRIAIE